MAMIDSIFIKSKLSDSIKANNDLASVKGEQSRNASYSYNDQKDFDNESHKYKGRAELAMQLLGMIEQMEG